MIHLQLSVSFDWLAFDDVVSTQVFQSKREKLRLQQKQWRFQHVPKVIKYHIS